MDGQSAIVSPDCDFPQCFPQVAGTNPPPASRVSRVQQRFKLPVEDRINANVKAGHPESDRVRPPQQPDWQIEDRAQQAENAVNRNPYNAERDGEQPNNRVQHERQQRQRPAQDEQDAPQQKSGHSPPPLLTTLKTAEKFRASRSSAGAIFALRTPALPLPVACANRLPARRGLCQAREPAPVSSLLQVAAEAKASRSDQPVAPHPFCGLIRPGLRQTSPRPARHDRRPFHSPFRSTI